MEGGIEKLKNAIDKKAQPKPTLEMLKSASEVKEKEMEDDAERKQRKKKASLDEAELKKKNKRSKSDM